MKKLKFSAFILLSFFILNACDNEPQKSSENALKIEKIAVGTDIKTIVKPDANGTQNSSSEDKDGYRIIKWEDLEIPGKGIASIIQKFEKEIDSIPEGSLKEKEVMERMQAALNSSPVNPALDKKKIKLAGFVSPLEIDEKEGVVKEFLLVPYFGACIHVPPPPLNQTLLVKPKKDQHIKLEDTYEPVWVSGVIHADSTVTKLAEAGYKISDVRIEPYKEHLESQEQ